MEEVSLIEYPPTPTTPSPNLPNILLGKDGVSEQNGNRSEYIKWCGVWTRPEQIVPHAPFKLGTSGGVLARVCGLGDYEWDEKWNVHRAMCAHGLWFSVIVFSCHTAETGPFACRWGWKSRPLLRYFIDRMATLLNLRSQDIFFSVASYIWASPHHNNGEMMPAWSFCFVRLSPIVQRSPMRTRIPTASSMKGAGMCFSLGFSPLPIWSSQPARGGGRGEVARGAATDMSTRRAPAARVSSLTRGKLHPRSTERRWGRRDPVVAQRGVEFCTANPV